MARTDMPSRVKTPAKKYITFSAGRGTWQYWNGTEDVSFDTIEFVLMEVKSSITGWNESSGGRLSSNLIDSSKDELVVRCKNKELYKGSYAEGKAEIAALGGNYTNNLFCYGRPVVDGAEHEIIVIQVSNTALQAWMDFVDTNGLRSVYGQKVTATRGEQQKKGSVKYYSPEFKLSKADPEILANADELTITELKPYLEQ